jgi:arabinofuranan 3-O-arabinosyltransferase
VIRDAAPGRTYRVRMEYRTVEGKRPQICLFQPGSDGCSLTARPVLSDRWAPFEAFVTVDDVATGLQVVLQANVGQRLLGTTTVEYRGLTVDALDAVATTTVFPPEVAQTPLTLTAGTHTISVEGGPAGSILEDFEPLQDCFRYDDQTPEQAGLIAQPLPDEPGPAFRLGARAHMACIGATAPAMGDVAMYELSFDGRSVVLRNPKVCLYLRGPDRCQSLPPTVWNGEWQTYALHVAPDPGAAETRLYLYGLRDLNGKRSSQVDYRAVRLRPVASTSTVVLVRRSPATSSADVTWSRENPTRYPVTTTGAPTTVVLRESYAPGWQLQPTASSGEHIAVQGWANAWLVPADGSGTVVYAPARIARYALLSLPIAVVLALVSMVLGRWWYRRRQRRKQEAADRLGAASVPADPGASPDDSDSDEEVIP